jgi:hypothetical protein
MKDSWVVDIVTFDVVENARIQLQLSERGELAVQKKVVVL